MAGTWLDQLLRSLFFFLDKLIFGLISLVYNLFIDIAETTIFSNDIIKIFSSRIYALLGVFMLFKVSFSILSYVVNPDDFADKNKGISKMAGNIIISLFLLVATPWIFNGAMSVQRMILRDNVIGKLFSPTTINQNVTADPGNVMAYETFKAFYHLNTDIFTSCEGIEEGNPKDDAACKATAFNNSGNYTNYKEALNFAYLTNSIDIYTSADLVNQKSSSNTYAMSYTYLISTLCGGVIVLLLITFCFDVAVRSVKIGFLRIIAPVPIVSRILPKKGKETFDKWLKVCISTYLDLFIRLIAIYFALFIISQVTNMGFINIVTGDKAEVNAFVKVFIILGALLFAKQLPKLIEDLTGMKMSGSFTLNPMNKIRQVPLVGAGVTAGTAMAAGAITGGIAGAEAGRPLRGAWQGMMGARNGIKGKVPLMGDDKGKSPHALRTGMQSGYKTIKGKDFEIYSPWKHIGHSKGEEEIKKLKKYKYALQGAQANFDAELHNLYDQLNHAQTQEERARLRTQIRKNRREYGEYSKHISVIDDQIKDLKKLYYVDESPQSDLKKATDVAKAVEASSQVQSAPSTPQEHEVYTNVNDAVGIGHNASQYGAPTAENSIFNDIVDEMLREEAKRGLMNNDINESPQSVPNSATSAAQEIRVGSQVQSAPSTPREHEVYTRVNDAVGIGYNASEHGAPTAGNSALEDMANEIIRDKTKENMMNNNSNNN